MLKLNKSLNMRVCAMLYFKPAANKNVRPFSFCREERGGIDVRKACLLALNYPSENYVSGKLDIKRNLWMRKEELLCTNQNYSQDTHFNGTERRQMPEFKNSQDDCHKNYKRKLFKKKCMLWLSFAGSLSLAIVLAKIVFNFWQVRAKLVKGSKALDEFLKDLKSGNK